jgi:hypothetical protein
MIAARRTWKREMGMADEVPRSVRFELDDDVRTLLRGRDLRTPEAQRTYFNKALRAAEQPPYRLHSVQAQQHEPMSTLLEPARFNIVLVGLSLRHMAMENQAFLEAKVRNNVSMTIILLKRISRSSALYAVLEKQFEGAAFVDQMLEQVKRSTEIFLKQREEAARSGTTVHVYTYEEVPMCGIIMRDHLTTSARMLVSIYAKPRVEHLHRFWEIDPVPDEGRRAYDAYVEYYDDLRGRSMLLP